MRRYIQRGWLVTHLQFTTPSNNDKSTNFIFMFSDQNFHVTFDTVLFSERINWGCIRTFALLFDVPFMNKILLEQDVILSRFDAKSFTKEQNVEVKCFAIIIIHAITIKSPAVYECVFPFIYSKHFTSCPPHVVSKNN